MITAPVTTTVEHEHHTWIHVEAANPCSDPALLALDMQVDALLRAMSERDLFIDLKPLAMRYLDGGMTTVTGRFVAPTPPVEWLPMQTLHPGDLESMSQGAGRLTS